MKKDGDKPGRLKSTSFRGCRRRRAGYRSVEGIRAGGARTKPDQRASAKLVDAYPKILAGVQQRRRSPAESNRAVGC